MLRALFHTMENLDGLLTNGRAFRDTAREYDSRLEDIRDDTRSVLDKVTAAVEAPTI